MKGGVGPDDLALEHSCRCSNHFLQLTVLLNGFMQPSTDEEQC